MTLPRSVRSGIPALVIAAVLAAVAAGCGSSSGTSVSVPQVAPARVFTLGNFAPTAKIVAGHPTTMAFSVKLPNGKILHSYKTGPGPHTGVHLIIVRKDLAYIIHQHPPIPASGIMHQRVTFPAPGPYRVLVDVYPDIPGGQPNFQLFRNIRVAGAYHPQKLPPFKADEVIDRSEEHTSELQSPC